MPLVGTISRLQPGKEKTLRSSRSRSFLRVDAVSRNRSSPFVPSCQTHHWDVKPEPGQKQQRQPRFRQDLYPSVGQLEKYPISPNGECDATRQDSARPDNWLEGRHNACCMYLATGESVGSAVVENQANTMDARNEVSSRSDQRLITCPQEIR